mmetsp:Transcript_16969/g.20228  ORF Transcript_16969/g.20228 Transcript_16969/m.20228 type:complete len:200 (-) Transcript_16969:242-841(-)
MFIWLRKSSSPNINLDGGNNQLRDCQLRITTVTHVTKFLLRLSTTNVDVAPLFITDRGLPSKLLSAIFGKIVMANKDSSLVWKHHDPLDGFIEHLGRPTWKVTAGCTIVRHEKGVASEKGIANQIAYASWCVTWSVDYTGIQLTDLKGLAICKELVELRSILWEVWTKIENSCKHILNEANVFANGNLPSQLALDIGCC